MALTHSRAKVYRFLWNLISVVNLFIDLLKKHSKLLWFVFITACSFQQEKQPLPPCSPQWYSHVNTLIKTGDDLGHGTTVGSDEWKSVIEFKLGLRGKQNLPAKNTEEWCQVIDQHIKNNN